MIGVKVKDKFNPAKIKDAVKRANFRNLGHAGAAIRLTARRSIRKSKNASVRDTASHETGTVERGILYAVEQMLEA